MLPRFSNGLKVLLEALLVVMVAGGLSLAANRLSSRGLALDRNYFPAGTNGVMALPRVAAVSNGAAANNQLSQTDQRLRDKGLQPISIAEVVRLFNSSGYRDSQIVFVDARNQEEYNDGHIPGAWRLDPYHPERNMDVLGPCQAARQVVVYCTGGECEDADSTALWLRDAGVAATNLFVFGGGFEQWSAEHRPIERGNRDSGEIEQAK